MCGRPRPSFDRSTKDSVKASWERLFRATPADRDEETLDAVDARHGHGTVDVLKRLRSPAINECDDDVCTCRADQPSIIRRITYRIIDKIIYRKRRTQVFRFCANCCRPATSPSIYVHAACRSMYFEKSPTGLRLIAVAHAATMHHLSSLRSNTSSDEVKKPWRSSTQSNRSTSIRVLLSRSRLNEFASPRPRVDVAVPAETMSAS